MKKILVVLAMTLTGFLSQAQTTSYQNCQRGPYSVWNLDTVGVASTTTDVCTYGESKTFSVPTNFAIIMQIQAAVKSGGEPTVTGGLVLYGSMDNVSWFKVALTPSSASTNTAGAVIAKTNNFTYSGTWPACTMPATAQASSVTAAPTVNADTTAFGVIANATAINYTITIERPTYTYYKLGYSSKGSANTTAKYYLFYARYYLRKPY
jgi:hypothetical protein